MRGCWSHQQDLQDAESVWVIARNTYSEEEAGSHSLDSDVLHSDKAENGTMMIEIAELIITNLSKSTSSYAPTLYALS